MSGVSSVAGRSDIAQVLADMRNLRAQIQRPEIPATELAPGRISETKASSEVPKFGDLLTSAVNSVNAEQMKSANMAKSYEQGDPSISLSQVMIQSQKSSVAFEALTQVRNKVVKAYEDVMNMPV